MLSSSLESSSENPINRLYANKEIFSSAMIAQIMKRMNISFRDSSRLSDEYVKSVLHAQSAHVGEVVTPIHPELVAFDRATRKAYLFSLGNNKDIVLLPATLHQQEVIRFSPESVEKESIHNETFTRKKQIKELLSMEVPSQQQETYERLLSQMKHIPIQKIQKEHEKDIEKTIGEFYQEFMKSLALPEEVQKYITSTYTVAPFFEENDFSNVAKVLLAYIPDGVSYELMPFSLKRIEPLKEHVPYIPVLVYDAEHTPKEIQLVPLLLGKPSYHVHIPIHPQHGLEHSVFQEPGMQEVKEMLEKSFLINGEAHHLEQKVQGEKRNVYPYYTLNAALTKKVNETPERLWFLGTRFVEKRVRYEKKDEEKERDTVYTLSYDRNKKMLYFFSPAQGDEEEKERGYPVSLASFLTRLSFDTLDLKDGVEGLYKRMKATIDFFATKRKTATDLPTQGIEELKKNIESIQRKYRMNDLDKDAFLQAVYFHLSGKRTKSKDLLYQLVVKQQLKDPSSVEKLLSSLNISHQVHDFLHKCGLSPLNVKALQNIAHLYYRDEKKNPEAAIRACIASYNEMHNTSYELYAPQVLCIHKNLKKPCVLVQDTTYANQLKLFQLSHPGMHIYDPLSFEDNKTLRDLQQDAALFINTMQWLALFDQNLEVKQFNETILIPADVRSVLKGGYESRSDFFVGMESMTAEEYAAWIEKLTVGDIMRTTHTSWKLYEYLTKRQQTHDVSTLTINLTINAANLGGYARKLDFVKSLKDRFSLLDPVMIPKQGKNKQENDYEQLKERMTVGKVFEPMMMLLLDEHIRKKLPNIHPRVFASNNLLNGKGVDMLVVKEAGENNMDFVAVDLSVKGKVAKFFSGYDVYRDQMSNKLLVWTTGSRPSKASHIGTVSTQKDLQLPLNEALSMLHTFGILLDYGALFPASYNAHTSKIEFAKEMNLALLKEELGKDLFREGVVGKKPEKLFEDYMENIYTRLIE